MGVNLSKVEKKAKNYSHVLLVMRHAKAEPFNDKGDHDREITDKGEKQAKIVAKGLVGMKLLPDRVACSGAVRARQTLERMLKVFGDHPRPCTTAACRPYSTSSPTPRTRPGS